jgi:ribonucleoside-diphosphate reductase alpha chain
LWAEQQDAPMRNDAEFSAPISREIWDLKYRLKGPDGRAIDSSLDDTFWRAARAAASAEKGGKKVRER